MRTHFAITALLALACDVSAFRVLGLFPHTGRSHQMVFEPLLYKLAERGHEVTVVSHFPTKKPPVNYTDVSLEGIADLGIETFDLNIYEQSDLLYTSIKYLGLERIFKQVMEFQPLAYMALDTCNKLVDWPGVSEALSQEYDVILVENFNSDCMLGLLHVYGNKAPIVAMLSSNLMPWSAERIGLSDNPAYVPGISTAFANPMNFLERFENTLIQTYFKLWFRFAIQVKEQEILENHFGRKIPDLQEMAKNTSLMIVNAFHSLSGVRPLVPGLVEVGGMHLSQKMNPIPDYIQRFLDESEEGVVVLSFGSLIKTSSMPKYKEQVIVNVLSKLKQRVIWKYEDSNDKGTLVGNILRVKWIPQYELLQHKKVVAFIAHGGLLGMTEAISAGKPMLVIPFFGDQPQNGAAATTAGLARMISYGDLNEEDMTEALDQVLSAEMRLSAREASQIWKDRQAPALDTAVYWTERVARWGSAAPVHSAARSLSLYQQAMLDVTAAYLFIIVSLLLILRSILYFIPWFICSSLEKPKEKKH